MNAKGRNQRKPKAKQIPSHKNIRKSVDPSDFFKKEASWAVRRLDRNGQWGWDSVSLGEFYQAIHPKLRDFESMTWQEIISGGSHNIEVYKLITDAQKRLEVLNLNDLEELFSLRLEGVKRIWGILERGILHIIWYDPKHEVYVVPKRYT